MRANAVDIGVGSLALCLALAVLQLAPAPASDAAPGDDPDGGAAAEADGGGRTSATGSPAVESPLQDSAHADAVASYQLKARLDADKHVVHGTGTLVWKNRSHAPVYELWFHLYLNAFKNDETLFLRSPFGSGRDGARASDWGYIDVKKLTARELGNVDLWPGADKHSPDDPKDQTDIRVPLPRDVEPGQSLTLDFEFESRLPSIVARTGYSGDFHMVAQWFPKIARLEPDGHWAHFSFHSQSEFYADFGRYEVELDVPSNMVVAATGVRVGERAQGDRSVLKYRQNDVHDFAWSAWPHFLERRERIGPVDVRVLFPPGNQENAARTLESLRFALPELGRRYGPYPYPTLSVVHPPDHARNAGGMEYPTLITTGGPWYVANLVRTTESVTIHELGHQWFYGMVASDEHSYPYLDEGLNSFAEFRVLRAAYGHGSLINWPGLQVDRAAVARVFAAQYGPDDLVAQPAANFSSFRSLGGIVYARTATILDTFANVYGQDVVGGALGRYARRQRFHHPGPDALFAELSLSIGPEAVRQMRRAFFERATIDYVAGELSSTEQSPLAGVFDDSSGRKVVEREARSDDTQYIGRFVAYRHGELELPVSVELIAEDGSRSREVWDGRGRWHAFEYRGRSPLVGAVIDPERRITLDQNLTNNAATRQRASNTRIRERAVYVTQLLMEILGP